MDQPLFLSTGTDQFNNGMFLFSARAEPFADSTSDDLWAGTIGFDLATLCGCNEVAYREPRWYGVSVRYNF